MYLILNSTAAAQDHNSSALPDAPVVFEADRQPRLRTAAATVLARAAQAQLRLAERLAARPAPRRVALQH